MATIAELKSHALAQFAGGKTLPALRLYDAIVASYPLDFEARLRVADCLAALQEVPLAARVYRATAWYSIKAGHPLVSVVAAKVLESLGDNPDDLLTGLVAHYGRDSALVGKFAARISLPPADTQVAVQSLDAPVDPAFVGRAAERAATCTDGFEEYPEAVHAIPLLSSLSEAAFRRVLQTVVVRRMADGQLAIREGEPGQSFFFVATGAVRVFDTDGLGRERDLASLRENSIFGEMALLSAQPRSASVAVVGEADLIEVTRDSLAALADELEQVASALHEFTRERLLSNLMARSPLFKPFSKVQQRELLRRFTSHDVISGTDIIVENDLGRGLFMVLSGELEVVKDGTPLATLRTGEVFGEIALLRGGPTSATVSAVTPSTVLFLAREYVERIIAGVPEIRTYLQTLAEDREMDTRLTLGQTLEEEDGSVVILF